MNDNTKGGSDNSTHHLITFFEPPASLVALRQELMFHSDITTHAAKGSDFSDCLGIIALHLDIALDGMYDCSDLCEVLVEALRNRRFFPKEPHLRAKGLVDVEMVEKEGSIELVERDRNVQTIASEEVIVTETNVSHYSFNNAVATGAYKPAGSKSGTAGKAASGDTKKGDGTSIIEAPSPSVSGTVE